MVYGVVVRSEVKRAQNAWYGSAANFQQVAYLLVGAVL